MNVNWNEFWKEEITKSFKSGLDDPADAKADIITNVWDSAESARRYLRDYGNACDNDSGRVFWSVEQLRLQPNYKVLEIGSGPGVLTIPIAKKVRQITVVEQSAGMIQVLNEYASAEGVSNISCIQKRWEDITDSDISSSYDVVFASLSLAIPDIQAAIEKMNHFSAGTVTLFWFADAPGFEKIYQSILPEITGKPYYPVPRANILFNLAYSMGLFPEVGYGKFNAIQHFLHETDIVDFFKYNFHIMYQKESEVFKRYMKDNFKETTSGFEHENRSHIMVLRWNV